MRSLRKKMAGTNNYVIVVPPGGDEIKIENAVNLKKHRYVCRLRAEIERAYRLL